MAIGKTEWFRLYEDSPADDWRLAVGDFIQRDCPACANSHKTIVYKRITDGGDIDFRNLFLHQVTEPVVSEVRELSV